LFLKAELIDSVQFEPTASTQFETATPRRDDVRVIAFSRPFLSAGRQGLRRSVEPARLRPLAIKRFDAELAIFHYLRHSRQDERASSGAHNARSTSRSAGWAAT
jgi:hypothetical protein